MQVKENNENDYVTNGRKRYGFLMCCLVVRRDDRDSLALFIYGIAMGKGWSTFVSSKLENNEK